MKKSLIVFSLLLCTLLLSAQPKGKKKEEEKPPTQKEMDDMMKELQKAMGDMDPEDKKAMDSLGIKMPDVNQMKKNMSGVSDADLKTAWENENRIVPLKDATRIATISPNSLNASSVGTYVGNQHTYTAGRLLPASKSLGEKIYLQLKAKGSDPAAIGNNAAALWIMGRIQPALYIMGRVCAEDISNTDNLNNYASMLSMSGAEQKAIPLLNYLNSKFPRNSTLLNNLGQAWFGLGDIQKAEKYLDSAIRIYAYHPQATFTKSFIEESKGNKPEAVTLVRKSLAHSYSQEKEERLRKLGQKLSAKDLSLPGKPKADPLNLGGFAMPAFPKSVEQCISLKQEWKDFRQQLSEEAAKLRKDADAALQRTTDMYQKQTASTIAMVNAAMATGNPQGNLTLVPMYASESYIKQNDISETFNRKMEAHGKHVATMLSSTLTQMKKEYDKEMEKLREEDGEQTGEGKPNKDFCPKYRDASDKFLRAYNAEKEKMLKEYHGILKTYLNEMTYWQMYSEWPQKYEWHKLTAMITWLDALKASAPYQFEEITEFKCTPVKLSKLGPLAKFDDVACQYHSELRLGLGVIRADCSNFTTELDMGVIKFGLKQDMDKETFSDQFVSCNVEIGAKVGRDVKMGPVTVEASAGARVGLDIDRTGVKDVYVVGGVKAGAGTNIISGASEAAGTPSSMMGQGVSDLSLDGGIEGRISIISGRGSIYGTGIFGK